MSQEHRKAGPPASIPENPGRPHPVAPPPAESAPPVGARITLEDVKRLPDVVAFVEKANEYTGAIGFTEHGVRHSTLTANIAFNILKRLGLEERHAQLAAIAAYLHDIGNLVGRHNHEDTGAVLAGRVLASLGMDPLEQAIIMGAIGNHEEPHGEPVSPVSAAVILSDKSDVHRSRVRNPDPTTFDIHDRVNYAVEQSFLRVDEKNKTITLELTIDTSLSQVMEYFEIFLSRMVMCRRAAEFLGCAFKLQINGAKLL
ncbi:MAG TPA: HD domain-containing protein [bacterium]|jgi:hypothetical protein|nr:HD domain-containing protein [bacterium]